MFTHSLTDCVHGLVELEDAPAAEHVAAVGLHREAGRIVTDGTLVAVGTDATFKL